MYKVCFSASHFNLPKVAEFLEGMDTIYTTQWNRLEELKEKFPCAEIRPIPYSTYGLIEYLKTQHPSSEFFSFGDVFEIVNTYYRWVPDLKEYIEREEVCQPTT